MGGRFAADPSLRSPLKPPVDWSIAALIARERPVILSGGLTAGNVAEAVRTVAPYAIDVSSGVELAFGRKDPAKLRALFAALKAAEHADHAADHADHANEQT